MQVDHIQPKARFSNPETIDNYNPSCARCNNWKGVYTVEEFRHEIMHQTKRVREKSAGFRLAEDYGLIQETGKKVIFCFEKAKQLK